MRRLFFGMEVHAPWFESQGNGRMIADASRHATLAFLGSADFSRLVPHLETFPAPLFRLAPVGICDKILFLPKKVRVVAGHVTLLSCQDSFTIFYRQLMEWLEMLGFKIDRRDFLPHVTLARAPFEREGWETAFYPVPVILTAIHLYESVGDLVYTPLWSYPLILPFEEIEHTADIAFIIRGETIEEIHLHAFLALADRFPPLIQLFRSCEHTLDDIIIDLNHLVNQADEKWGCPFKAVCFHGSVSKNEEGILTWEMIIDV